MVVDGVVAHHLDIGEVAQGAVLGAGSQVDRSLEAERRQRSTLVGDVAVVPVDHVLAIRTDDIRVVDHELDIQILVLAIEGEVPFADSERSIQDHRCRFALRDDVLVGSVHLVGVAVIAHKGSREDITLEVGTDLLLGERHSDLGEVDRTIAERRGQVGVIIGEILGGEGTAWVIRRCKPLEVEVVAIL